MTITKAISPSLQSSEQRHDWSNKDLILEITKEYSFYPEKNKRIGGMTMLKKWILVLQCHQLKEDLLKNN